jgi:hypothetical protein
MADPPLSCAARVGSGEACRLAFPDQCPEDEYCNLTPAGVMLGVVDSTCVPRPAAGEPCGGLNSDVCAANARCNPGADSNDCKALTEIGGGCNVDAVCYSDHCVDGTCASANSCE